jgi:hypothetical protein
MRLVPSNARFLVSAVAALLLAASDAAADLTPPCCAFDTAADCSNPDAACPAGGTCRTARCGSLPSSLDKCLACPVLIGTDAGDCTDPSQIGRPCGASGTCQRIPQYCGQTYVACAGALDWDGQAPLNSSCIDGADGSAPDSGFADSGSAGDAGSSGGNSPHAGGGGGCQLGGGDVSSIALAWLFAAAVPAALRRAAGARRRR